MGDDVEPGAFLVVGVDHVPRGLVDVAVGEHFIFGHGILDPACAGLDVHWAEFPTARPVLHSFLKPFLLHDIADVYCVARHRGC